MAQRQILGERSVTSRLRAGPALAGFADSVGRALTAVGRSLLAALAMLCVFTALTLAPIVIGLYLYPPAAAWLARVAAAARTGARVSGPAGYSARAGDSPADRRSIRALVERISGDVVDSGFWRTMLWAFLDLLVVWVTAMLPLLFAVYGVFGALVQPFVWRRIDRAGGSNWYAFVHVDTPSAAAWSIPLGVLFVLAGVALAPFTDRAYAGWIKAMLAPTHGQLLAARNRDLATTRADVVDDREAGLARIQRDLHDGAQARLVAMGMNLDQAVGVLDADPARARSLLAEAQQLSTSALAELRDLVHGIHSPVLADRGLGDAVRSLLLDTGFDADVTVTLPSRPAPPVEAAVYYAISELVTNAAKHSQATAVAVRIGHGEGELTAVVYDNGVGGADDTSGRGLLGVRRRLAAFDGTLRVESPRGGPTIATTVVPCTLS